MKTIDMGALGAKAEGADAAAILRTVVEKLRETKSGARIVFPKGRYEFRPERAFEELLFMSNNDSGVRRVAFELSGLSDIEIDGQGSEFVFNGRIVPFHLFKCENVSLKSFSIDWKRSFHSEGVVEAAEESFIDLRFDSSRFPYDIHGERLVFKLGEKDFCGWIAPLEFDPVKRETAFMADNLWIGDRAERLANGLVRMHLKDKPSKTSEKGNVLAFGHPNRLCPALFCDLSKRTLVQDVVIFHAGGMGVLAQRCEDVKLERVKVSPAPGRVVSTNADATHFAGCRGKIELLDCLFECQLDDPANVHGVYSKISAALSSREVEVRLVHPQQRGVDFNLPGDEAEAIDAKTLLPYFKGTIESTKRLNEEFTILKFREELPKELKLGDSIGNLSAQADLVIRGCETRGNRARGFLISTAGNVLVEDCRFHNAGAALLIEGDANFWFESGNIKNVTARRNKFDNCLFGPWGKAVIQVTPGVAKELTACVPYHKNLSVTDNVFETFTKKLLYARCVEGLSFERNTIVQSSAYPCKDEPGEAAVKLDACAKISIAGNKGADDWTTLVDGKLAGDLGKPLEN